jgi:hypothetical protein
MNNKIEQTMRLKIKDKVFVPVSENLGLRNYKGNRVEIRLEFSNYNPEIGAIPVKEETNKYVLSREELENLISNVVELSRDGIVVHRVSEWETEKEFDYNDSQIISLVL